MKFNKKTILRFILLSIGALIIGLNIYTLNAAKLTGNAVPMPFGVGASVVLSGSMEPELSTGDLIFVTEKETYEVNDVVVFQQGSIGVVHRIISIDGETVITKGDANNAEDTAITMSQIKGIVSFSIPFVGYIVNIIKNPVCTICIVVAMFYFLEKSYRKEKQKKNEELNKIKEEIRKLQSEL